VSASSYESSSLPLLEGLASGCVALASDIEAHIEMANYYPIVLFDLNSPKSFAKNIENVIHEFNDIFAESAIDSRRGTILKCDWQKIAQQYLEQFEKVTNK
jgi:glycosyltransferase involved in cell wall biosynthesis